MLGFIRPILAKVGVKNSATAAAMTLDMASTNATNMVRGRCSLSIFCPGTKPIKIRKPISTAMDPLPGIPKHRVGMSTPASMELFAASGAITPRMSPLPKVCRAPFSVSRAWA